MSFRLSRILGSGSADRIGITAAWPRLRGRVFLPKDIRAFVARTTELGVGESVAFLREVDAINRRCRSRTINLAQKMVNGTLSGCTVGILGVAFKPDSDDIRNSPALEVARTLRDLGARVTVYDPAAMEKARQMYPQLNYARSAVGAASDADVLLLLTEWAEVAVKLIRWSSEKLLRSAI